MRTIYVVYGTNIRESTPIDLPDDVSLLSWQEELIQRQVGVGRFFRMANDQPKYIAHNHYRRDFYGLSDMYYQVIRDREPILDDVHAAILLNDAVELQRLVPKVFSPDERDVNRGTLLEYAYNKDQIGMFELLLQLGANVNTSLDPDRYLINVITEHDNLPFIQLLVKYGADLNIRSENDNTPLMYANSIPTIAYLLENGAIINDVNKSGQTTLYSIIFDTVNLELVQFLISKGADVNKSDNWGYSPLHIAACCNRLDIVTLLLSNGADPTARNSKGKTAECIARNNGYPEAADLINDYWLPLIKEPEC